MSDDKINLDLINMVQNARMQHDADAQPSQVPGVYWIEAKPKIENPARPTPTSGEWRIPTTLDEVDTWWQPIKQATEAGTLGHKSKVSTVAAQGQAHPDQRLICVRTVDATDSADVERVRQKIVTLLGDVEMRYQADKG